MSRLGIGTAELVVAIGCFVATSIYFSGGLQQPRPLSIDWESNIIYNLLELLGRPISNFEVEKLNYSLQPRSFVWAVVARLRSPGTYGRIVRAFNCRAGYREHRAGDS